MRKVDDRLELSASDLASHLGCRHLTQLDLLVANGGLIPPRWRDPTLEVLQQRGLELEQLYLDHLRGAGLTDRGAGPGEGEAGLERTIAAMRDGADVDLPGDAAERSLAWPGRFPAPRRDGRAGSAPGPTRCWTPSSPARPAPAPFCSSACTRTCCEDIQGVLPERMHVVMPGEDLRARALPRPRLPGLLPAGAAPARGGDRRRRRRRHLSRAGAALRHLPLVAALRPAAPRRRPSLPRGRDLQAADPGAARPGRRHAGGARASCRCRSRSGPRAARRRPM